MTEAPLSEFITGECRHCGDEGDIYRDNKLCMDCDGDIVTCCICDEEQHADDPCRHVFQNSDFEWMGAGVGLPNEYDLPRLKTSLFRLFDLMPDGFAADLRTAISAGQFHTWIIAPIIGAGGLLELHGMPDRDGKWMVHAWSEALTEIGGGEQAEETVDGYRWLVSLYNDKTPEANAATVAWIDEWLARLTHTNTETC